MWHKINAAALFLFIQTNDAVIKTEVPNMDPEPLTRNNIKLKSAHGRLLTFVCFIKLRDLDTQAIFMRGVKVQYNRADGFYDPT